MYPRGPANSQITSDICHIDESRDEVADTLFRPLIAHLQLSPWSDHAETAAERCRFGWPCDEDVSGHSILELLYCNLSTLARLPFVPPSLRPNVFASLHNRTHPGSQTTDTLVSDRCVWPGKPRAYKLGYGPVSEVDGAKFSGPKSPPSVPCMALVYSSVTSN
ncbi:unnamed protein product [Schistocephalus solidus]|uniref:Integrase_H2C2 domain-containing protein n=1 Tax=Schistocephalus solidus TaxID=70667 RepID=A0A183TK23_SCHSO|nr:unnamed protein product [Schistocephalus solidus]